MSDLQARPNTLRRLGVAWRLLLGRPGLVGVAALGVAIYALLGLGPSLKEKQAELVVRQARQAEEDARPSTPRPLRQAALSNASALLESLPPAGQRGADLARLVELSRKAGVELSRGDYAIEKLDASSTGDDAISQWRLQLPVRGNYAQLRRFIAETLNNLPHVALDGLQVDRPDAASAEIETTLRITFFYRGGRP